jgi:hypothetical protein
LVQLATQLFPFGAVLQRPCRVPGKDMWKRKRTKAPVGALRLTASAQNQIAARNAWDGR